jgi:hypothetical protein
LYLVLAPNMSDLGRSVAAVTGAELHDSVPMGTGSPGVPGDGPPNCRPMGPLLWHPAVRRHGGRCRHRYRVFACAAHIEHLDDPRGMSDDDRAELAHRREQWAKAKAGQQFERVQPILERRVGGAAPPGGGSGRGDAFDADEGTHGRRRRFAARSSPVNRSFAVSSLLTTSWHQLHESGLSCYSAFQRGRPRL